MPGVRNLMGKLVDGSTVLFTWETDALGEGDSFLWNRTDLGADQTTNIAKASEVRVQLADAKGDSVCSGGNSAGERSYFN